VEALIIILAIVGFFFVLTKIVNYVESEREAFKEHKREQEWVKTTDIYNEKLNALEEPV